MWIEAPFDHFGNFKGHKVKKKLALAGLGAPSEIVTFEPIEIKNVKLRE